MKPLRADAFRSSRSEVAPNLEAGDTLLSKFFGSLFKAQHGLASYSVAGSGVFTRYPLVSHSCVVYERRHDYCVLHKVFNGDGVEEV